MRGRFGRISPHRGYPGWAKALDRVFWFLVMILALARPPAATSATIQNEASGSFGGLELGAAYGTVVLNRVGGPVSAATFEVTPSELPLHGRQRSVRLSLLPVLRDGDLGIEVLRVGLGPGLTGVDLTAMVDAQGDTLTAATDPSGTPEEDARYAKEITGENVLQVRFPHPWAVSQAALDLYLTVDAVGPAGSVPIEVQLAAGSKTSDAVVGDANGDPSDGDAGEIQILSGVDPDRSVVYAEPPVILADDFQEATVVAILVGADGVPYPGKEVRFESSRPGLETLVQPTQPTDANGRVTARIRSGAVGVSTLIATDVTDGITLGDQATVAFTQGAVLSIEKSGGADNVTPGDIVTYRIEIDNQTDRTATGVQILDTPPEGFQYLSGSARLDDQRLEDPTRGSRLRFSIGDVASNEIAMIDSLLTLSAAEVEASSGPLARAASGSAPARVLTYALVAGANTRPGTYDNTAVAVDACDECEISNRSSTSVDVVPDDLFDRSLIVGKVFEDENRNGRQDSAEPGIGGVRVVLDDGSYSVTDPHGRYHLTRVTPGQRLVKVDTAALGNDVEIDEGPTRVLWISPGLLGRANFGVQRNRNEVQIGSPAIHGLEYRAELTPRPVEVIGYVSGDQALVNGTPADLTGCDAIPRLNTTSVVNLSSAPVYLVVPFELVAEETVGQASWSLQVRTLDGTVVGSRGGDGTMPRSAEVEIRSDEVVAPDGLQYRLDVRYQDGTIRSTSWRRLGVQLITQAHSLGTPGLVDELGSSHEGARAEVGGESVSLEGDGRFQTLWSASGSDLSIEVERSGGSRRAALIEIPDLSLGSASRETLGWDDARVRLASVADYIDSTSISVVDTLSLRTAPGNRVWVDGEWRVPDVDGNLALPVQVPIGSERVGVFVESAQGFRQIYDLDLGVAVSDTTGTPIVLAPGVPELSVDLPSSGVLSSPVHLIRGKTAAANRVFLNGEPVEVASDGTFAGRVELPIGKSQISVEVEAPDGSRGSITRDVEVSGSRFFLIALADGVVGRMKTTGDLAGAGAEERNETYTEGRLSYYLEGSVAGKVMIRSHFDTRSRRLDDLFNDLDEYDEARLLTYLDPDETYPIFGDQSTEGRAADTPGKFYLAVESEVADLLYGSYPIQWTGTELSSVRRVLHGARVRLESPAPPEFRTEVEGFLAEDERIQSEVRLAGTGGSLYYLPHEDIVEGSEIVTLVVRHDQTGLPLAEIPATRGVDYQIRYPEGRIWFETPVPSVTGSGRLLGSELLPGHPVEIHVVYETADPGRDGSVAGVRATQHLGRHLTLGGTYVRERLGTKRHELIGLDAEVHLPYSRLVAEWARSDRADSLSYASIDGGLDFSELTPGGGTRAEAWKVAGEVDLGKALGGRYSLRTGAYVRRIEAGFREGDAWAAGGTGVRSTVGAGAGIDIGGSALGSPVFGSPLGAGSGGSMFGRSSLSGSAAARSAFGTSPLGTSGTASASLGSGSVTGSSGATQFGVGVTAGTGRLGTAEVRTDRWEAIDPDVGTEVALESRSSVGIATPAGRRIQLAAQLQAFRSEDGEGREVQSQDDAGVALRARILGDLMGTVAAESAVDGGGRKRATAGLDYPLGNLRVGLFGRTADEGESAWGSVRYDRSGRLYFVEAGSDWIGGSREIRTTWGARQDLGRATTIYSEYRWVRTEEDDRALEVWGAERRWDLAEGLAIRATGEHSRTDVVGGDLQRSALAGEVSWSDPERIEARSRGEVRFEEGSTDAPGAGLRRIQYSTDNQIQVSLDPDWSLLGRSRFSRTQDRNADEALASLSEQSLGLAYRPIATDRVDALGRYSHRNDQRPGSADWGTRVRDIVSVEGGYEVVPDIELLGRYAARWQETHLTETQKVRTLTHLSAVRLELEIYGPLGLGTEYRIFAQREASDRKRGWLSELTIDASRYARVGLGYDFTDFEDDLDAEDDYTKQGWFLRLQGRY